jgi:hypothetical protein
MTNFNSRFVIALCVGFYSVSPVSAPAADKPQTPQSTGEDALVPRGGRVQFPVTGLIERINSFRLSVKGKMEETGPVVLSLDPSFRGQTISLDFKNREVRIDTHLRIDAPLLKKLGASGTPLSVSERGTFTASKVSRGTGGRGVTMEISYVTDSKGTITTGPLAGAAFRNRKHHCVDCCSYPANKANRHRISVSVDGGGTVTGGTSPSELLCAADRGTLTSGGHDSPFVGYRTGTITSR